MLFGKKCPRDENGVALSKSAYAIDCKNTMLRSESDSQKIVDFGLDNILAIAMPDAVLIAHREKAQNVKSVVARLKSEHVSQAEIFPKDHRPWGWFESLALSDSFQVKLICVNPKGILSLQSQRFRSEHWVVVKGTAKITIDEKVKLIGQGQSVHIPVGSIHRMENPGKLPMMIIEVQTGSYFGEDDIMRYEDAYSSE